jgi:hypothetical protein
MLPAALEVGKQASKNSKDATEKKASEEFVSKVKKLIKDKQLV